MDNRCDEDLVAAIGARGDPDPEALAELYRRHVDRLIGFAVRRLDDPEEVADLVAAVFLELIHAARRFDRRRGHALLWLYGLANKLLVEERRRKARDARAVGRLTGRLTGRRWLEPDEFARVEERIDASAKWHTLRASAERLSVAEREVLELVVLDELTPTEAAVALGIRPVAARVRLARARKK